MNRVIIAIGRQFGSGGREIGKALASSLDIPYYDKDLIALAAKKSGMSPETVSYTHLLTTWQPGCFRWRCCFPSAWLAF